MNFLKKLYEIYIAVCEKYTKGGLILWDPSTIIMIVISLVSMVLSYMMAENIDSPDSTNKEEGSKVNTRSTQKALPIVYGRRRVASNDVYGFTGGNEDKDLYLVMSLAEGECDSIYQVDGVDQVWLGDKLYTEYGDDVSYTFYTGSTTQTYDSVLHKKVADWTDNMRNTCYMVMKLHWDRDKFRGVPIRQVELKGTKCYNFVSEVTEWTDNPVLCLYNFFTNIRYGIGLDASKIDTTSWTTAKDYCTHKDFKLNLVVDRNDDSWTVIKTILLHFRGSVNYWDGKYYLSYADTLDSTYKELSVMTIEDEHINQDASGRAQIRITQPGRFTKPSGLRVTFIDAEKKYSTDSIIVGESVGMLSDFKLEGCIDREMASNLGTSMLERLQLDRIITGVFRDECIELEPNDIITFNSTALGISNQKMRVTSSAAQQEGLINLSLKYESDDLYNDDYDLEVENEYICSLPDPNSTPPNLENISIVEETYYYALKYYTKLNITFTEPSNYAWYDYFEIWMIITETADAPDIASYVHQFNSSAQFSIDPVAEGKHYWLKLRTINTWGVKRSLETTITKHIKVVGKSLTSPPSVSSLVAIPSDIGVNLYATKLTDPDIESYEFRLGSQWIGGIFVSDTRAPNYSITGVKPGIFYFTVNSKGSNGLYGDTPQTSNRITINRPKSWDTLSESFSDDYTSVSGVHTGTEHFIYDADDYLRTTHSGSVSVSTHWYDYTIERWYDDNENLWLPQEDIGTSTLDGTYTSPLFTASALDTYYIYVDLDDEIVVSGESTTWSGISPESSTWSDIGAQTNTWGEIWEIEATPRVYISLLYSEDDSTWIEAEKMELCSVVVTAKYFKVQINIQDPALNVQAYVPAYTLKLYT